MSDFLKFLEICYNFFKSNNFIAMFYILLLVISVWLYKEFRKNKIESDNLNIQRIDATLGGYGKVINSINKFKNSSINFELLMNELIFLYPYAPKKIIEYINTVPSNNENIDKINDEIKKEIVRLKKLQYDNVSNNDSDELIDSIGYYVRKNFESFLSPLVNTIVAIIFILLFLSGICNLAINKSSVNRIIIIINLFMFPIYCSALLVTIEVIRKKKFNVSIINIIFFVLFVILITTFLLPWKLFTCILFAGYTLIYIILLPKKIIRR